MNTAGVFAVKLRRSHLPRSARTTLSGFGSRLFSKALRDPDCRELPWRHLLPAGNPPKPIQCLLIQCDRQGLRRRSSNMDLNGRAFVEESRPILIAQAVPFFGLLTKSPALC